MFAHEIKTDALSARFCQTVLGNIRPQWGQLTVFRLSIIFCQKLPDEKNMGFSKKGKVAAEKLSLSADIASFTSVRIPSPAPFYYAILLKHGA